MAYSRKLHKIQKKRTRRELDSDASESEDSSDRKQGNQVENEGKGRKAEREVVPKKKSAHIPKKKLAYIGDDADLWGDSDNESPKKDLNGDDEEEEEDQANQKKNGSKRRGRKLGNAAENSKHRKSFAAPQSDDEDFENEAELETKLKPNFDKPKWPPTALEPFVLTREDEEGTQDQIPASMSRYIQGYQKEGVRFLHSIVTDGVGAVLGDDMGECRTHHNGQILFFLHVILQQIYSVIP